MENKIELLRNIIENSKRFEFVEDEVLRVSSYYNGNKSININFITLIEVMYEKLQEKENRTISYYEMMIIDDLVSDEEIESEYNYITFVNDDFFTNDRNKNYD